METHANVRFTRGEFKDFRATTKVHLGGTIGYLEKDDIVKYDGFYLKLGGREVEAPGLKSAIKKGWLVLPYESFEFTSQPAILVNTKMVEDDEKLVSTVDDYNQKRRNPKNAESRRQSLDYEDASSEGTPIVRLSTPAKQVTEVTATSEKLPKQAATPVDSSKRRVNTNFDLGSVSLDD